MKSTILEYDSTRYNFRKWACEVLGVKDLEAIHSLNKVTGFMRNTPTDAGVNYDLTFGTIKTGDSNAVESLRFKSTGTVDFHGGEGGTDHISHRLLAKGLSEKNVLAIFTIYSIFNFSIILGYVFLNTFFSVLALLIYFVQFIYLFNYLKKLDILR